MMEEKVKLKQEARKITTCSVIIPLKSHKKKKITLRKEGKKVVVVVERKAPRVR